MAWVSRTRLGAPLLRSPNRTSGWVLGRTALGISWLLDALPSQGLQGLGANRLPQQEALGFPSPPSGILVEAPGDLSKPAGATARAQRCGAHGSPMVLFTQPSFCVPEPEVLGRHLGRSQHPLKPTLIP